MNTLMDDPLLTAKEVAAKMRVNPRTVTNWVRQGKLTAIRTFGGHYRFRKSEVDKLVSSDAEHETRAQYIRGWGEWRPECKCGWVGSYLKTEHEAHQEAQRHCSGIIHDE